MHIHEGAWVVQSKLQLTEVTEDQKKSTSSSLRFQLIWWLNNGGEFKFCKTARDNALGQSLPLKQNWVSLQLICYLCICYFTCLITVLCFCIFCSLKVINYLFKGKHCGQAWITKCLRPKMASLMSRKPCLVLYLQRPLALSACMSTLSGINIGKSPFL